MTAGQADTANETPPTPARAAAHSLRSAVRARLGIDLRALAAFRIALGAIVLADLLLIRLPGLRTFYTDQGTLPRDALAQSFPTFEALSLHALSGSLWVQGLLIGIAAVAAGCLLVGYRTRLATAISAVLLASVFARNPYVLNGGDTIMLSVLLLGLFLPLGARWSVDACRRGDRQTEPESSRICTVATAVILVHFVGIYAVNGILKFRSEAWMTGTAVQRIFHLEQYVVLLGPFLTDFSALLTAANWAWVALLTVSPLLLLTTGRLRLALAGAFIGAQLGLGVTMRLGAFPFVMVAILLLYLPPDVWDRFEDTLEAHVPARYRALESTPTTAKPTIAEHVPATLRRTGRIAVAMALVCGLVAVVGWQAIALGFLETPEPVTAAIDDDIEGASWAFFAPNPPEGYWWYAWEADLESGETVGTLTDESGAIDRPPDAADRDPSVLWKRYGSELRYAPASQYEPLAAYYCEQVAADGESAESVTVYKLEQPVDADGPTGDLEHDARLEYAC
ncbi:HTTM domain-containing protein [Natronolimnobius sp. AArcel1]|uniref:HTTM domain-containing protein n=1 Tax=Natronolimnobius sp. AArcel1 TaxID=1679093 RepID=UPI0013EC7794|nr:HTTM domain-containing protein [Natronolimnobius sp. AArcel1]NGM69398.1 HTTM domain-containing protein [Natronolimnobius sp. AArcel1]